MKHKGQFKNGHKPMGRSVNGHTVSQETKDKIRDKALERYRNGAVPHNKGKAHTKETIAKMSLNHADVSGKNNPMYGKTPGLKDQLGVNNPNNKIDNLEVLCRNCHWLKHKDDK